MTDVKKFPTGAVLSTITGRLVCHEGIEGIYKVLNWMTGESVFTHQLPRIGKEAHPIILATHPELSQACEEAEQVTPDNWKSWLRTWEGRYGYTLDVPRFTANEHERIDPLSEAAEHIHPDKIVTVVTGESHD